MRYVCAGLVLLVIVFFALVRFRLRSMPLERDEGEYAYAGQLILQGIPPYRFVYSMKLPGTDAAYALLLAVFGQTPSGIHTGLILINAATALLIFVLALRLFGYLAATIAAASYALLSASASVMGFAAHASHFVVLPAVAGVLLLLEALRLQRLWLFFDSGLLLGLALVMKQPGAVFLVFAGVYLVKNSLKRPLDGRRLAHNIAALMLGGALPFATVVLITLKTGLFPKFWFWSFRYASQYAQVLTRDEAIARFNYVVPKMLASAAWVWMIAAVGLSTVVWSARARRHAFFLASFLFFSILAVCPGLYFREHYFIMMLPVVSLLAGVAVAAVTDKLAAVKRPAILVAIPTLAFVAAFAQSVWQQRSFFFYFDPIAAVRTVYPRNPFPEALEIASFIRSRTPKNARIAVLGSEPEIYFYSHRHSATGYIYTFPLMEPQKYAAQMQGEMIAEIEDARPEYMVYFDMSSSWAYKPGSDLTLLTWIQIYARDNYKIVDVISLPEPYSALKIYVFQRNS